MRKLIGTICLILSSALSGASLLAQDVPLSGGDLVPVGPSVWTAPRLALPEPNPDLPLLGPEAGQDGTKLLRLLSARQDLNGFDGIIYDNRDRGHSMLDRKDYPRLGFLVYETDLKERGLDRGLAGRIFLPHVVLGNASLAMRKEPLSRSLPRLAMTDPSWRAVTPSLYLNDHLYVYPEHRDHDAADLFPLNWPYMVVSQGSSGSDRAFLDALAMTLAAFPRETFAALRERRLVAPTLQMILRRNLRSVASREDYLSGKAHPPVFEGRQISSGRMVAQAAEMRPEDIPPRIVLRVVEEDFVEEAGLAGLSERLLDSHAAIGRMWRGFEGEREMIVTVADTVAPDGQDLSFAWRLLRGDPERVQIEPVGSDGRTARIRVAWHDPWTEIASDGPDGAARRLSRVDIGVFAVGGVHDSAPGLISIDFPEHQIRRYDGGPVSGRLASIDYDAAGRNAYFDPLLYWSAPWTDTARYDAAGTLLGWFRTGSGRRIAFVPVDEAMITVEDPGVDASNPDVSILRRAE